MFNVDVSARIRLDLGQLVAGHRHAGRIGPVCRVGRDDRVPLLSLASVGEVRPYEHEPGQLTLRAGRRLQRAGVETGELDQGLL